MQDQYDRYPVQLALPVQWADVDAAAHVNNLTYLRWAESARIELFTRIGLDLDFQTATEGTILGWQECKYLFPMTSPDTALLGLRVLDLDTDRFVVETAVFSERHQRLAAISRQRLVAFNYRTQQKIDLPTSWQSGLKKCQS